ncbi:MAG TPA: IS110 family transposase [Polyangiaceae bacterium]|nr:IS110 family transposase [Polyangiaceae bacterium]
MRYFVGLDWASTEHAVCVVDGEGAIKLRTTFVHSAEGLSALKHELLHFASAAEMPIAIERPSGLLVDTLVEAGFPIVPIHPNALKAARPRYSAAQAKSDPGDAYMLADLLRTDGHRFRALQPLSDETRALRALVRTRDDLVAERIALANQLRTLLEGFWPGAAGIFADVDSPIALAFLARYPTPASAERLGEKRLAAFLARHAYCGRRAPAALLLRLRGAPVGQVGESEAEARGELVLALVAVLEPLVTQIQRLAASIDHLLAVHPDGPLVASLPRAGRINAAQILAELGDERARFADSDQLAAEAGVAPVTRASGKHRSVAFRWACNKRLRRAITCLADNSRHASPWAADVYRRARARGCHHPHAVRILARAWLRVLWRCWQDRRLYRIEDHRSARVFLNFNVGEPAA